MWPGGWYMYVRVGADDQIASQSQCAYVDSGSSGVEYIESERKFIIECEKPMKGRYVSIQKHTKTSNLFLCEVFVYGFQIEGMEFII